MEEDISNVNVLMKYEFKLKCKEKMFTEQCLQEIMEDAYITASTFEYIAG